MQRAAVQRVSSHVIPRSYELDSYSRPMHRYQVFYCELPDGAAGYKPILAEDSYEAKQIVERLHPGAVMASLDGELTDGETTRKLFLHWLSMV